MMIRKTFTTLLAAFILLGLVPLALAQNTLTLGDGAPIPYLEGFTSRLIKDAAMLPGITGQTDIRFQQKDGRAMDNQGTVDIHIQNIALTDDAMALFFRAEFPKSLPLEYGSAQESYSHAAPYVMPSVNGERLPHVNAWLEGRPDGNKALQCLAVFTLENPIPDGAKLSFGGGPHVILDKSRSKDATRAVNPNQPVKLKYQRYLGSTIDFQATIARVSFGPFGNRILVLNRDNGRSGIEALPCALEDEAGNRLPVIETGYKSSNLASPANPEETYNEVLFLGGENAKALRLIPVQTREIEREMPAPHVILLTGPFPARAALSKEAELTVHSVRVNENGCTILYSIDGPDYVSFLLGDAQGNPIRKLNDQAVGFDGFDLPAQAVVCSMLWVAEYKGKPVSRVSGEDIRQAQALLVHNGWLDETTLLPELTVEVPIQ
ncbi:MAG: hypothetical protein ACOX6Y_02540 [Christensenellales bacterium]